MNTILVVDDFASVRFYHESLLKQAGYQTLAARDGAEALAALEKHPVELIMLDLLMPNMNGREFMQRVRALPKHAAIPILLITSEAGPDFAAEVKEMKHCALLNKPILPKALIETVRALLA